MMKFKNQRFIFVVLFLLTACLSSYPTKLQKAKTKFDAKDYIGCIDVLNLALPAWQKSDGAELKAEGYQLLGKAYHALGQVGKAGDAYAQAIKTADNTYEAAYSLGILKSASSQYPQALAAFQAALRMRPNDPAALVQAGNAYYGMNDFKNAKVMYERVLDTSPGVRDAMKFLDLTNRKLAQPSRTRSPSRPSSRR
jgi:tetratricopeptide (TPR) repeat protein